MKILCSSLLLEILGADPEKDKNNFRALNHLCNRNPVLQMQTPFYLNLDFYEVVKTVYPKAQYYFPKVVGKLMRS